MVTMIGLPASRASSISRQIVSDATADPPGLLTRITMARTLRSAAAWRMASAVLSAGIWSDPVRGLGAERRRLIAPVAVMTATVATLPLPEEGRTRLAYLWRNRSDAPSPA